MSVGQSLQAAREDAGLSVDQVSEATRIRATIVRAIEADDFSLCGGDFYARGHIRALAQAVGADPAPLVAEFEAGHGTTPVPVSEAFEHEVQASKPERPRGFSWSAAVAVVLVLVIVWGVVQLFTGSSSSSTPPLAGGVTSPTASAPSAPSSTAAAPSSPAMTPAPVSSAPTVVAARPGTVSVALEAVRGASWVRATGSNGKVLFEGIVAKGSSKDFSDDHQLRLVIGNAGSVDLTVNGKPVGAPGKPGDVVHLSFGPQDPAAA